MRDENGNITIKSVWKWLRSEKGKRYSFVIFYAIFFIFLFVFLSTPAPDNKEETNKGEEETSSLPFKTLQLENEDYKFTYQEIINETPIVYQGEKKDNTISLTSEDNTYNYTYQDGELLFQGESNSLTYYKLLDIYEIKKLIKDATFISKVEYPDKQVDFNYEIASNHLQEIFASEDEKDTTNKIVVSCNKDLEVLKITFDIYNYFKEINKEDTDTKSYLIEITYGGEYEKDNTN